MLSNFANFGRSRSIIFPEVLDANGWFGVAKLLKEVLIDPNKSLSRKQQVTPRTCTLKVSGQLSFVDVVRCEVGNSKNSDLKGWRCQNCRSWDVYAVVIGEKNGGNQQVSTKGAGKLNYGSKGGG